MGWSAAMKNSALDAVGAEITAIGLHSGDPGAAGTNNEITGDGYTRQVPAFAAAAAGEMALSAPLDFDGPASQAVSYFSLWAGATFYGSQAITSGDVAMNAAGEYTLTTNTKLTLTDPV